MLKYAVLFVCFYVCLARPSEPEKPEVIPILSESAEVQPDGSFKYAYETANGIKAEEEGVQKEIDKEHSAPEVHGFYEYKDPEGKSVKVTYYADATGYHAEGDVVPGIPPAIQKALKFIEDHPPPKDVAEHF